MFKSTDVVLVLARRGHGKSYLAKVIQGVWPRRIIFDTLQEYDSENTVYSFDEFASLLLKFKSEKRKEFEIVYQFNPDEKDHELYFDQALRISYNFGDVLIVIEEVQNFSTPHFIPHWLKNCLLTGRHRNLGLLFTSQRPGELNKTIVSQCAHIFAGQLHERNDLIYVSSFLNVHTSMLTNIQDRHFLHFSPGREIQLVHNSLTNPVKTKMSLPESEIDASSPDDQPDLDQTP